MIISAHGSHLTSSDGRAYSTSSTVLVSRAVFLNKTKKKKKSENKFMVARGEGPGGRAVRKGVWDGHVHTAMFKTDNQQRSIA